jgi:hypothetical protein
MIQEICGVLEEPSKVTTKIQDESLITCEFVEIWMEMIGKIDVMNSDAAKSFKIDLKARTKEVFENPFVLAGFYFNKKINILMTNDQKRSAKELIRELMNKIFIHKFQNEESLDLYENILEEDIGSFAEVEDEEILLDPLEKLLKQKDCETLPSQQSSSSSNTNHFPSKMSKLEEMKIELEKELDDYDKMERDKTSPSSWITYWKKKKESLPLLAEIALIAITVPVTEVSVERLFSHLNVILDKRRSLLNGELLNVILMMRCNEVFGFRKQKNN